MIPFPKRLSSQHSPDDAFLGHRRTHYKNETYENGGAQGLYLEVYEDQIIIKGREFEDIDRTSKYWFSNYQVVLQIGVN